MITILKSITKQINAFFVVIILFVVYFIAIGSAWVLETFVQLFSAKKRDATTYWIPADHGGENDFLSSY